MTENRNHNFVKIKELQNARVNNNKEVPICNAYTITKNEEKIDQRLQPVRSPLCMCFLTS